MNKVVASNWQWFIKIDDEGIHIDNFVDPVYGYINLLNATKEDLLKIAEMFHQAAK